MTAQGRASLKDQVVHQLASVRLVVDHAAKAVVEGNVVFEAHSAMKVGCIVACDIQPLSIDDSTRVIIAVSVFVCRAVFEGRVAKLHEVPIVVDDIARVQKLHHIFGVNALGGGNDNGAFGL